MYHATDSQCEAGGLDTQRLCAPPSETIVGLAIPSTSLLGQVCSPEAHSPDRTAKSGLYLALSFFCGNSESTLRPVASLPRVAGYPGNLP